MCVCDVVGDSVSKSEADQQVTWRNILWLLKNSIVRKWLKNFALGCPTNDVLDLLDILHPPNFACLGGN